MNEKFSAKFQMTKAQNIFLAKRNIVDYIWKSAKMEGLNVTFPETYAIYEKAKLKEIDVDTVLIINNLKHGWQKVLNSIDQPLNLNYICEINAEIARDEALEWGKLRNGKVGIGGTNYVPPIPKEAVVEQELMNIITIDPPTKRAIRLMLWGMKSQLFWDGNKRTSMLVANKIMIENGCGIISVSNEFIEDFHTVLSDYYTNDTIELAEQFIYDNCIDGIQFEAEES